MTKFNAKYKITELPDEPVKNYIQDDLSYVNLLY